MHQWTDTASLEATTFMTYLLLQQQQQQQRANKVVQLSYVGDIDFSICGLLLLLVFGDVLTHLSVVVPCAFFLLLFLFAIPFAWQ